MNTADIDSIFPEDKLAEFARSFLREYLKDGFGASPKRHTDLHVFHLLETLGDLQALDNNMPIRLTHHAPICSVSG